MILVATSVAFLLFKTVGGDQFSEMEMNPEIPRETIERGRRQLGYDKPVGVQYIKWLTTTLSGNLQFSHSHSSQPVTTVIARAVPPTLLLMGLACFLSIAGGIALGLWQGTHIGSRRDRLLSRVTLGLLAFPDFWIAMILILVFGLWLHVLPTTGMTNHLGGPSFWDDLVDRLKHLVMPLLSLTLVDIAYFARFQRAAVREILGQQFLRTARAKGVDERQVVRKHALRVAVLPVITLAGMYFPALLVGAVLVEKAFAWPGMGSLLSGAIERRDYFLVNGIIIVGSAMTALGSFLADVVREIADPRLRST